MKAHAHTRRPARRTGVSLALAATTVAAMAVPAGAATVPATQTVGATALSVPTLPRAVPTATYRVRAGDTVSAIAARTGTSVAAIVAANNLGPDALIKVGQVLRLPSAAGSGARTEAPRPTTTTTTHTVVAGDTVSALAKRYGTTVAEIVAANRLDSRALIVIGQRLTIPGATSAVSASGGASRASSGSTAARTHVVRTGETVSGLAKQYGTTVSAITSANGLRDAGRITIGQRLTIPGAAGGQLVGDTFLGRTYADDVVSAANANKATLNSMDVPSRAQMRSMVRATAERMGVDPALALAVAQQESGFDARAVSPANAVGVMQVIPSSGEWASTLVGRRLNLLDPQDNVTAGVAILRQLVRTAPDLDTAIAGYYQGLAGVLRNGMYSDTRNYVAGIKSLMRQF